jgi:hypothetical protein
MGRAPVDRFRAAPTQQKQQHFLSPTAAAAAAHSVLSESPRVWSYIDLCKMKMLFSCRLILPYRSPIRRFLLIFKGRGAFYIDSLFIIMIIVVVAVVF